MVLTGLFTSAKNVLIFRSNIDDRYKAAIVCAALGKMAGVHRVNVDLDDWENILRLECDQGINEYYIQQTLLLLGFDCTAL